MAMSASAAMYTTRLIKFFSVSYLVLPQRRLCVTSYSSSHETSNICTSAFGKRARGPRSGAALQRRFRDAPLPDTSGKLSRTLSSEDRPESGMRLANSQERHPRLQRSRPSRSHARLLAPQARPRCFRQGERRGSEGDAPPLSEGVRIRDELVDFGDGRRGRLRGGPHREAGLWGDRPGHFGAPTRSGVAQSEKVDHLSRPPVRKKKRRRDRLMAIAEADPETWAVGFEDECWWSRVALPTLNAWGEGGKPLRLIQRSV